jgi:hypothetical protein
MTEHGEDIVDEIDVLPRIPVLLEQARDEIVYLREQMAMLIRQTNELKQKLLHHERPPDRVRRPGSSGADGQQAPGAPEERSDGDVRPVQAPEAVASRRRL